MKRLIFTGFFCVLGFGVTVFAQKLTPELLNKAREMGVSETRINEAINTQQGNTGRRTINNVVDTATSRNFDIISPNAEPTPTRTSDVFGSEIFSSRNLSFEPNFNMPTPDDYKLAAGDELIISIWGSSEANYINKITPDGTINIPDVGVIFISGLTVAQAEKTIVGKLSQVFSGIDTGEVNVKVALGKIRSIKVNIAGEAAVPGTYTLPSLSTLFNALYLAGGVNNIGSLRDIRVYRNNKEVARLDAYDYIINGKYETNITLSDNDMVVVSPYQNHVKITGKVKRNRTFELKKDETLDDLVRFAGGFSGDAYTDNVTVNRKAGSRYSIFTVDNDMMPSFAMMDKDSVSVDSVIAKYDNRVIVRGAVWRPGEYQLSERLNTVKALIDKAEGVKGNAFLSRSILKRQKEDYTYEVLQLDIPAIINGASEDIALRGEDEIYIPSMDSLREKYSVTVRGEVNGISALDENGELYQDINAIKSGKDIQNDDKSGYTIPYMDGMSVEDAIILAGGFKEAAAQAMINVVRRIKDPLATQYNDSEAKVFEITLENGLALDDNGKKFVLEPFDEIIVRRSPAYIKQSFISVEGEVVFQGTYNISSNMRLSDVVEKAGGLTPYSYVKGAQLRRRLSDADIAKLEAKVRMAQSSSGEDSLSTETAEQITTYYPVAIDLEKAMKNRKGVYDIVLQEGDKIIIPQYVSTVKISGAVVYPNATTYLPGKKLKEYILNAGGYMQNARKRAYVVYMNGQVATTRGSLFGRRYPKIEPGAEIIVPFKQNRNRLSLGEIMGLTSSVTSVAALVNSMVK